jgi:hypothetical protein
MKEWNEFPIIAKTQIWGMDMEISVLLLECFYQIFG